jgi:ribose transport system substrate-binding protein
MNSYARQQAIQRWVEERGSLNIREAAAEFGVSTATIRTDLQTLESHGLLVRVHGGAARAEAAPIGSGFLRKEAINRPQKQFIAQRAVSMIENGDTLALDSSTTCYQIAKLLKDRRSLTVFTNGINVATALSANPTNTVILIGGVLRAETGSLTGRLAEPMLAGVRIGRAFVSCVGFAPDLGMMEDHLDEAAAKRAIIEASESVVVLADSSKFQRKAMVSFVTLDRVDHVITDDEISPAALDVFRDAGIAVSLCGQSVITVPQREPGSGIVTIGFANLNEDDIFQIEVRDSIERAAKRAKNVRLLLLNNRYDSRQALANVESMIAQKVDLFIEYQTDERLGYVIMDRLRAAGIPVIAVDIPLPGATYFGVDNYRAGQLGGEALAAEARRRWNGRIDRIIALGLPRSGPLPAARIQGQIDAIRQRIAVPDHRIIHLDSQDVYEVARQRTAEALETVPRQEKIALVLVNDSVALGAAAAVTAAGRSDSALSVSQGADRSAREEMARPGSIIVGAVTYSPETYGDRLIPLAQAILAGQSVPPAVFQEHRLVTARDLRPGELAIPS